MWIKADLVPEEFKTEYKLHDKIHNGYIYMEIQKGMYGLPQSGISANKLLKKRLAKDGYLELPKHITCPVQFKLVVDDVGIKSWEKSISIISSMQLKNITRSHWMKMAVFIVAPRWNGTMTNKFLTFPCMDMSKNN